MGKQGANVNRSALANALRPSGADAIKVVKKEEPPREPPKPVERRKKEEPVEEVKTKKQIEEEQRQQMVENDRQRAEFYAAEAAKKIQSQKSADTSVTYIQDKDSRKPKAVSDISEYWKAKLDIMPFLPTDNVGVEAEDVDPNERFVYLSLLNEELARVLRLKFHIFWSQVIYDSQLRRSLDSYLRFCLRSHDQEVAPSIEAGEAKLAQDISRRVLAIYLRLSRPQETSHDFISFGKWGEIVLKHQIFDVPKLIDLCAIYGDTNRSTVTRIVHSVFANQSLYKDEFKSLVPHMMTGLHQCCAPLRQTGSGSSSGAGDLGIEDCLLFLPDILSSFNAVFCFFPEECVDALMAGRLEVPKGHGSSSAVADPAPMPLAEVLVNLFDSLHSLERSGAARSADGDEPPFRTIRSLLARLLCFVLGVQMSPRHGEGAFDELLEWCRTQEESRGELLLDMAHCGLEHVAIQWHASGLVDEERMNFLEEVCGPLLPAEARTARQRHARSQAAAKASGPGSASASGAAAGAESGSASSAAPASSAAAGGARDQAKIREVREVVGSDFGEGFILRCLLHYSFSVQAVIAAIFDGSLPPQLETLPKGLKMFEEPDAKPELERKLSQADKALVMGRVNRMEEVRLAAAEARAADAREDARDARAAEASMEAREEMEDYDDDVDDAFQAGGQVRVGNIESGSEGADGDSEAESSEGGEASRWPQGAGKGKGKGRGKGPGGPVQGQTYQARRKETNKAVVGNHNRRQGADRKLARGMAGM